MTLTAYRVVKAKRKDGAFTGEGARKAGGRWSSKGVSAVYASSTLSLAVLEILVHLEDADLLDAYGFFPVTIPDSLVQTIPVDSLPPGWSGFPAPAEVQAVGDAWLRSRSSAVLRIPSAVFQGVLRDLAETNYLLNPDHPDFVRIGIGPFQPFRLDPRLAG